jgi:hypothetical protein
MEPCKPKQCPPMQKWDSTACKCKRSRSINTDNNRGDTIGIRAQPANVAGEISRQAEYENTIKGRKERREKAENSPVSKSSKLFKKGGSTIKGNSLRRQASSKGLRTSKKH